MNYSHEDGQTLLLLQNIHDFISIYDKLKEFAVQMKT